jgi:hypothetical protein
LAGIGRGGAATKKKLRKLGSRVNRINCALDQGRGDSKTSHGVQFCASPTFLTQYTLPSFSAVFILQVYPAMADEKPNCKVILANNIAKSVLEEVRDGLSKIERKPLLVGFLSSSDPAARVYAEWTGKTCTEK